jgi:DNA-binding CsgD family transcriptional regulator
VLQGRRTECAALDRLLEAARGGHSGVVVVRGEAGVGKSALLEYALGAASEFRVRQAAGVESEMELPFAGLHQLCAPLLAGLDRLPAPQQNALETAFGLSSGTPPDRFFVGLAALGLLSDVSEERPLLCSIDDAQWLDGVSAQALAFVARRLQAESVVLLFATRESSEPDELTGLPELLLKGLSDAQARKLLAAVIPGPLDQRVANRIVAETKGNPLALLELPRGLTTAELAGGFGLPDALPLSGRIEESFRQRVERLPAETRRLLLLAAADPVGDPGLLWRAGKKLALGVEAAVPAETDGLLELGERVTFRHPLVRSAVYRNASAPERREVHQALADETDPNVDPDRRAWHRAQATPAPDEMVAAELEHSASRAQARGGLAAAAAFLEQAARLTPEPAPRAGRALAAAHAKYEAGAPNAALGLLARAEEGPLDELGGARVDLLRGQIAFAVSRGRDAPPLLLKAAKTLEPLNVELARETYLEALSAAMFAGRLAEGGGLREAGVAARAAPPSSQPFRGSDLLLNGLATRFTEGYAAGAPTLQHALTAFRRQTAPQDEENRWRWLACWVAMDLWDDESWDLLSTRHVQLVRDAGALTTLPIALSTRIYIHLLAGELAPAATLIEEAEAVTEATGSQLAPYGRLALAALQGRETDVAELVETTLEEVVPRGEGFGVTVTEWASALLYNGLCRYEDALTAASQASEHFDDLSASTWALPELIEAAVRSRNAELASQALQRLSETTRASGTAWALGIEARSQALLSESEAADTLYRKAIRRLGRSGMGVELARGHLLYGEWLRRENRRTDAREQLRTAHELFFSMGVEAFAERAARELLATGEKARKRTADTRDQLTAQETQIAELARDGHSNPEIGAQLFISPRTVEYHLHKVFTKLEISSRNELQRVLPSEARQAQPV